MTDKTAIRVSGVHKTFKLPHEKVTSIKSLVVNFHRRKKSFERQHVLDGVSFDVKTGEFFGIVGRNGSGKSTMLKLLAGIYAPNQGAITVNGKLTPFIELGVGFNHELSGRENVFLNGALLGFSRREMEAMYDDIVEFAELGRFMDQKLKNYSSGMQVRLAFSIAIQAKSDILLIDEVLAVGDANFQQKCFEYFRQLKTEKRTVILVSHDMESVRKFCDRALMLESGKVVMVGDPEKVSEKYVQSNTVIAAEAGKPKKEKKKRPVEYQARITSAKLVDVSGKSTASFLGGSPAKVTVDYTVNRPVEELNIGIGLHSLTNGYVFSYNTQMDEVKLPTKTGRLVLDFDQLPILPGRYHFNVVCFGADEFVPYDLQTQIIVFDVYGKGKEKRYRGVVNLKHKWVQEDKIHDKN